MFGHKLKPLLFGVGFALWNLTILFGNPYPISLAGHPFEDEAQFSLRDPYVELTNGVIGCGRDCHGTGCLELSHDEFRFRQHLFIPGQRFIGDNTAGASGNTGS